MTTPRIEGAEDELIGMMERLFDLKIQILQKKIRIIEEALQNNK